MRARRSQRQAQAQKVPSTTATSAKPDTQENVAHRAQIETDQITSIQQSLAAVQIVLHSSISTIAWFRDLFHDECFEEQWFYSPGGCLSYDEYANGNEKQLTTHRSVKNKLRVMRKGKSERMDKVLDWLERGVFVALGEGRLRALQVSLSEFSGSPDKILELYTFNFRNTMTNEGNDIELAGPTGERITVGNVRSQIQSFTKYFIRLNHGFPRLPDSLGLRFQLFHTVETPSGYAPEGFESTTDHMVLFPESNNGLETFNVPSMDAGYHEVSLFGVHRNSDGDDTRPFNGQFSYGNPRSVLDALHTEGQAAFQGHSVPRSDIGSTSPIRSPSERPIASSLPRSPLDRNTTAQTRNCISSDSICSPVESDSDRYKQDLQRMQRLTPILSNAQETQLIMQPTQEHIYTSKHPMILSQTTLRRLGPGCHVRKNHSQELTDPGRIDLIRCACDGNESDEETLLPCEFCGKWQHYYCHGYESKDDPRLPRLPQAHVCYSCLLKDDRDTLHKVTELAVYRRAIHVIETRGFYGQKQLNKTLQYTTQDIANITNTLIGEGFLVQPAVNKKKTPGKRWDLNKSAITKKYFDPSAEIAGYYELPPAVELAFRTVSTSVGNRQTMARTVTGSLSQPLANCSTDVLSHRTQHQQVQDGEALRPTTMQKRKSDDHSLDPSATKKHMSAPSSSTLEMPVGPGMMTPNRI